MLKELRYRPFGASLSVVLVAAVFFLVMLACVSTIASAADIRQDKIQIPVKINYTDYSLKANVYRPEAHGRYPLIVIAHGRQGSEAENRMLTPEIMYVHPAKALAAKGFTVVVPVRHGYGSDEEKDVEHNVLYASGLEAAKNIAGVVAYMRRQQYVDEDRVVLMGQSAGGLAVVAASTMNIEGVVGVVNFAGGLKGVSSDVRESLFATFGLYGMQSRIPMLWIYSENDSCFPPVVVYSAYNAFIRNGGRASLHLLPPFQDDGHFLFGKPEGIPVWMPLVEQYLASRGVLY